MTLYNTADTGQRVSLKEAVLQSLAPSRGLYMPTHIPVFDQSFFTEIDQLSFQELSFLVAEKLLAGAIPFRELESIVQRSINFPAPLVPVHDNIFSLELWHGPSLAFKDFGARFMAELMFYFTKDQDKKITILVATSGDTGGAVASGFLNVPNTEVIILYPSGKVSPLQEQQLTTLGNNIVACEVKGTFDDCQALVKEAFTDDDLNQVYHLSSANSINIARLIPQSFYYFEAYKQVKDKSKPIYFSVPSGNFGNLTAGLIAWKMGLPVHRFIAATNMNHIVPDYLQTGEFVPKPSVATISNAMDVGNPSNFVRMKEIFGSDWQSMARVIQGKYYSDEETKEEMKQVYQSTGYVCDPHGAIAHRALRETINEMGGGTGIFVETAHPAKFDEVVGNALSIHVEIPKSLQVLMAGVKNAHPLGTDFVGFKQFLLNRILNQV